MRFRIINYLALVFFFATVAIFNRQVFAELFNANLLDEKTSDGTITEFVTETSYRNLQEGKSPFARSYSILYPFGVNYVLDDPGIGILPVWVLLRPFLSVHKTMIVIILIHVFLAGVFMYLLLTRMGRSRSVAILFGLSYLLMPFLSHRMLGHYTYLPVWIFPLGAMLWMNFLSSENRRVRVISSALLGVVYGAMPYFNFYYTLIGVVSTSLIALLVATSDWKNTKEFIRARKRELVVIVGAALATLSVWLAGIWRYYMFNDSEKLTTLGGAIHYSADIFNLVTPNEYNPLYASLIRKIEKLYPPFERFSHYYFHNWERFIYPGLLILLTCILAWINRKWFLRKKEWQTYKRFALVSLLLLIFTFGPFLKVAGKWSIDLEGVAVVMPLPFLIFRYIPGMSSLRVPGRFIPGAIFFACLAGAWFWDKYLSKFRRGTRNKIVALLIGVVLIDQYYVLPKPNYAPVPVSLYRQIGNMPPGVVLELPYTVRDGLRYLGFVHALSPMQGTLIHGNPVMGGYMARVEGKIFDYYGRLKFVGYLGKITDRGNYNPLYESPKPATITEFDGNSEDIIRELDFFGIRYILIKQNEPFTEIATKYITRSGGKLIGNEEGYRLYVRDFNTAVESVHDFGGDRDELYIADGFTVGRDGAVLVKEVGEVFVPGIDGSRSKIVFTLSSNTVRTYEVYVNEEWLGREEFGPDLRNWEVDVPEKLQGVADVHFRIYKMAPNEALGSDNSLILKRVEVKQTGGE